MVDLPTLAERLKRPCVAVMRRLPDLSAVERALRRLPRPELRLAHLIGSAVVTGESSHRA